MRLYIRMPPRTTTPQHKSRDQFLNFTHIQRRYSDRQENVGSSSSATKGWVADDIHSKSASRTLYYFICSVPNAALLFLLKENQIKRRSWRSPACWEGRKISTSSRIAPHLLLAPSLTISLVASWKRAKQVVPEPDQTTGGRKATSVPTRSMLYTLSKNSSHCADVKPILCGDWMNTLITVSPSTLILGTHFIGYRVKCYHGWYRLF